MIRLSDLTEIRVEKLNFITSCLDDLLLFRCVDGIISPVITGYNWYLKQAEEDKVITFSHIHETEKYKQDMLKDLAKLGYSSDVVLRHIREKAGAFLHDLEFEIKDSEGHVLTGLKVKDARNGQYIDLEKYDKPLANYVEFKDAKGHLVAEDQGWELDFPFHEKEELLTLVNLFLDKSSTSTFDNDGNEILESADERKHRNPWADAYRVPVLVLGSAALKYTEDLPHFIRATKFVLRADSNEISFIINKNLDRLHALPHYGKLLDLGFKEEICLGNKPFIASYVDKNR